MYFDALALHVMYSRWWLTVSVMERRFRLVEWQMPGQFSNEELRMQTEVTGQIGTQFWFLKKRIRKC